MPLLNDILRPLICSAGSLRPCCSLWLLLVIAVFNSSAQGPVINEFLALNTAGLTDTDGATSDWIEIYNPSPTIVSLHGWSLTDDPDKPRKWQFPDVNFPASAYLLVFASG